MKKLAVAVAAMMAMMLAIPEADANPRPDGFGLGLGAGTAVSGISGKYQMGDSALQGVIGCWGYGCHGLGFSGDYLINMPEIADADVLKLAWNLGGGAAVGVGESGWARRQYGRNYGGSNFVLHAQFVIGLELIFPDVPLDVVFEYRPSIRVVPAARLNFDSGGAHIRYYFQ